MPPIRNVARYRAGSVRTSGSDGGTVLHDSAAADWTPAFFVGLDGRLHAAVDRQKGVVHTNATVLDMLNEANHGRPVFGAFTVVR